MASSSTHIDAVAHAISELIVLCVLHMCCCHPLLMLTLCAVPSFTFVQKFWATLLFILFAALMFAAACVLRLVIRTRAYQRDKQLHKKQQQQHQQPTKAELYAPRLHSAVTGMHPDDNATAITAAIGWTAVSRSHEGVRSNSVSASDSHKQQLRPLNSAVVVDSSTAPVVSTAWIRSAIDNKHSVADSSGDAIGGRLDLSLLEVDSPRADLWKRLQHSLLILLAVMYLRTVTMICSMFVCSQQPDPVLSFASNVIPTYSLYLDQDGSTLCFRGAHLLAAVVCMLLALVYCVGYPLLCFTVLTRAFGGPESDGIMGLAWRRFSCMRGGKLQAKAQRRRQSIVANSPLLTHQQQQQQPQQQASKTSSGVQMNANSKLQPLQQDIKVRIELSASNEQLKRVTATLSGADSQSAELAAVQRALERDRCDTYGFLYLGLRIESATFIVHVLLVQAVFGCISVFGVGYLKMQLFLFGLLSFLDASNSGWQLPYARTFDNLKKVLISCATIVHSGVLLAAQSSGATNPLFFVLTSLLVVVPILLLFKRRATVQRMVRACIDRMRRASVAIVPSKYHKSSDIVASHSKSLIMAHVSTKDTTKPIASPAASNQLAAMQMSALACPSAAHVIIRSSRGPPLQSVKSPCVSVSASPSESACASMSDVLSPSGLVGDRRLSARKQFVQQQGSSLCSPVIGTDIVLAEHGASRSFKGPHPVDGWTAESQLLQPGQLPGNALSPFESEVETQDTAAAEAQDEPEASLHSLHLRARMPSFSPKSKRTVSTAVGVVDGAIAIGGSIPTGASPSLPSSDLSPPRFTPNRHSCLTNLQSAQSEIVEEAVDAEVDSGEQQFSLRSPHLQQTKTRLSLSATAKRVKSHALTHDGTDISNLSVGNSTAAVRESSLTSTADVVTMVAGGGNATLISGSPQSRIPRFHRFHSQLKREAAVGSQVGAVGSPSASLDW